MYVVIIKVDQSGKVEDTSKPTVVAFSNGISGSIFLAAREKRKLQRFFRKLGKPRLFAYKVFATLTFILIRNHTRKLDRIIIDPEYPGYEEVIRNWIWELLRKHRSRFSRNGIVFQSIGKRSRAHIIAHRVFNKLREPDIVVTAKDIQKIVTK